MFVSLEIQNSYKGAIGVGAVVLIVVALLFIIIIAIVAINNGNSKIAAPAFPKSNMPIPAQLSSMSNLSSPAATQNLVTLAQSHLENLSQYTISYSGTISIDPSGIAGTLASINSPFSVNYYKFHNSSRFDMNITTVPLIGRLDISYLNNSRGSFFCSNFNTTAISSKSPQAILSGSGVITCSNISSISVGVNVAQATNFNISAILQGSGINFVYSTAYQTDYQGIPCTYLTGPVNNASSGQIGTFQMCISNTYYVPLSFLVHASTKQGSFSLAMNETQITNSSSQNEVESLPGPVN